MTISRPPIVITREQSTSCLLARCEITKKWLSEIYTTLGYSGKAREEMLETMRKTANHLCKIQDNGDILWVTFPAGYWLKDGRLVSPEHKEADSEPFYGTLREIISRHRNVQYNNNSDLY